MLFPKPLLPLLLILSVFNKPEISQVARATRSVSSSTGCGRAVTSGLMYGVMMIKMTRIFNRLFIVSIISGVLRIY